MILRPVGSPRRNSFGRVRANVDRLDHRTLLSGATVMVAAITAQDSTLSIVAANPAGSPLMSLPSSGISITFDRPLDPFTVQTGDVKLEHLANNGSTTPLGPYEPSLIETLDISGTKILLTPSSTLPPGNYRLVLSPNEAIRGLDGTSLAESGRAAKIEDFRIGSKGVGLAGATDLGVPDSTVSTVSGSLDFSSNPDPVKLYKVEIPAGQFDRLGVEVSSTRDGSALQTDLSLFDASGRLISTSTAGRPDFPLDPYLFAGIGSGTYYIGVSGGGDVPGRPGGYDPLTGLAGTTGVIQAGGNYRLHFVADAVTQPTQVLGIEVDHADPESTMPTGLTIQFSATIQVSGRSASGQAPVELVDSNGQVWSVMTTKYDDSTARLSLVFDQAVPAGTYSVVTTGRRSLLDLTGRVPVAAEQSQGVLGTISVVSGANAAGDLGALLPNVASSGLTTSLSIPAGSSVTKQLTIVEGGTYAVTGMIAPVGLGVTLLGGSPSSLPIPSTGQVKEQDLNLVPGVYELTFTNSGSTSVNQAITINRKAVMLESFVETGIGQGPALGLRLVSPSSFASANTAATGVEPQPAGVAGPATSTSTGGAGQSLSSGDTYGPTVLNTALPGFVSVGTPLGRPTLQSQYISIVGPAGNAEGAAMSSNGDGLPGGPRPVPVSISLGALPRRIEIPSESKVIAGTTRSHESDPAIADGLAIQDVEMMVNELEMADTSWIDKIVGWTMSRLESASNEPARLTEGKVELAETEEVVAFENSPESGVANASLASPVGFGVALIVALRYRDRKSAAAGGRRGPMALQSRSR